MMNILYKATISFILLVGLLNISIWAEADVHTHFNTEATKPGVLIATGLRSDLEIGRFSNNSRHENNYVHYDAVEDAAAALMTGPSLGTQVRPAWTPAALTKDGDELWVQFEVKWDENWLPDDLGGLRTHKAFQFADGRTKSADSGYLYGAGNLKFEIRSSYSKTDSTAVGAMTYRYYQSPLTDGGNGDDIRYCANSKYCSPNNGDFDYDTQPGGDTWCDTYGNKVGAGDHLKEYPTAYADRSTDINPFLWLANTWNRITVRWRRISGVERITIWAQNESTGPVKILADPKNSAQGYKVDYADDEGFNQFWFEFNSSQEIRTPGNWYIFFRNFIASTKPITLGDGSSWPENKTPSPPASLRIMKN